ncbi:MULTISPECIES: heme utilization protein HutZ [Pasteurellaceae]|uniref:Heme utilization protein n=1 Tax=Avibacterium paragallinarum TaxID=728 RepID=A0A377IA62_AVIPA|nr:MULTISPECIES: heme utilization protein HutZ [Pasteurellaceae]MDK9561401.1 heme utilization protein HutZ [Gallibacterium anatis]POY46276.1 heme utilization protein HutZ [Avibacterium paragallinarum]RZN76581.1 heme utilization protein HutZ [Avibacterium paragallinarum]STO71930.1 heme utilization protein [Avibacterium paragallinarum]
MLDRQQRLNHRLKPEIEELKQQCKTLLLATVDEVGMPNASYAPFAESEKGYYIFISTIAKHARNLKQNGKVSLMLIEDEQSSRQIFARHRLTAEAEVIEVPRNTPEWELGTGLLQQRHGNLMKELVKMQDFSLFHLIPKQGLFVKGFGQAFQVDANNEIDIVHLDQGHIEES